MRERRAEPAGLVHSALFYRSEQEYIDAAVPFIADGLDMDQPTIVALPEEKLAAVRDGLGDAAVDVAMADITESGRNPNRLLGLMGAFVAEHPDQRVRMVGEPVWPGRTADEYPACVQYEALCNTAFATNEVTGLCLYDAERLADTVLFDACTTHPLLWRDGTADRSADYSPDEAVARYNQPLPTNADAAAYTVRNLADLTGARTFASRYAGWLGLSQAGIADLLLTVTELATNSLQHAKSHCRLAFWQHNGHLVCQAHDRGRLDDPLAGHRLPAANAVTGRGLFLVNTIADLVRTHAAEAGTTIQAYFRLTPSPGMMN